MTMFKGKFFLTKTLNPIQVKYLKKFNKSRRMKRDVTLLSKYTTMKADDCKSEEDLRIFLAAKQDEVLRKQVNLPYGNEGEFFCMDVKNPDPRSQASPAIIISYNDPPASQPGLWCGWMPSDDGNRIIYDGSECFYHYIEWIRYIVNKFLIPWGHQLDGVVEWHGEDDDDTGTITIVNNIITVKRSEDPHYGEDVKIESGEIEHEVTMASLKLFQYDMVKR